MTDQQKKAEEILKKHEWIDADGIGGYTEPAIKNAMLEFAQWFASQDGWVDPDKENPWPLVDVLKKLVEATDILLHEKAYDRAGWEEMEHCYKRGKEIIKKIEAPLTTKQ